MKLPQLSLRDLFWLVALVAMGCGWWVDRRGRHTKEESLKLIRAEESQRERLGALTEATAPTTPGVVWLFELDQKTGELSAFQGRPSSD